MNPIFREKEILIINGTWDYGNKNVDKVYLHICSDKEEKIHLKKLLTYIRAYPICEDVFLIPFSRIKEIKLFHKTYMSVKIDIDVNVDYNIEYANNEYVDYDHINYHFILKTFD